MQKTVKSLMLLVAIASAGPVATAADMTWPIENRAPYEIELQFYSRTRNAVWPGGNRVWYVRPGQRIFPTLACSDGEYICYGAWPTGSQTSFWGVGRGGRQGCTSCCYVCMHGSVDGHTLNPY